MSASPLTALVDRFVGANEFTGAAVIAYHRGALVREYYAGHAAPGIPATADTIWPLASISKVYSAATMMRLVELGEVTLNTRAKTMLTALTGACREDVRIRHLLKHTGW